ncbi:TM2 domain-containing protein [Staphylococcus sp. NWU MK-U1]|uniref:TM2 domain-containing protein n=1 Tax=Staphylococcus sp. NWU MK-U1 TaxID=3075822 RepID=UPI00295F19D8|nr:NINE protein [Staphylococcus sp. NWU MK-U1]
MLVCLGSLGAHRFYRKQYGKALLYIFFCWTGIPGVIGMIEGVIAFIKTADAQGNI